VLNWFKVRGHLTLGAVEGFYNKAKLSSRNAYGNRSLDVLKIALYHRLSDPAEPDFTDKFC
jgi:transposase